MIQKKVRTVQVQTEVDELALRTTRGIEHSIRAELVRKLAQEIVKNHEWAALPEPARQSVIFTVSLTILTEE